MRKAATMKNKPSLSDTADLKGRIKPNVVRLAFRL